jgi:hypothetical protein
MIIEPYSTNAQVEWHLRRAHELRAAYMRAALRRLLARCRVVYARLRRPVVARGPDEGGSVAAPRHARAPTR